MNTTEAIFRERAAKAAMRVESAEHGKGIDVIAFKIGNENYALEAEIISEVYPFSQPTPLPYTPSYIQGIVHIRGRFVSIVNLKHFFGMETQSDDVFRTILLLCDGEMEFGVSVDEVLEQSKLPKESIQTIPSGVNLPRPDLIIGVSEEGLIVLSGKKLLGDPAMRVHQEIATSYKGREHV